MFTLKKKANIFPSVYFIKKGKKPLFLYVYFKKKLTLFLYVYFREKLNTVSLFLKKNSVTLLFTF